MSEVEAVRTLDGTPYLPGESAADLARFERVAAKSRLVRERVDEANIKLAALAQEAIARVHAALQAEQVAESNRIEGYNWTRAAVEDVVSRSEALLNAPVRDFLEAVHSDPHAFEALGLVQAHRIADEWISAGSRPGEVEIRQLHQLVTAGQQGSGEYRTRFGTTISRQAHAPPHPMLVRQYMGEFFEWWTHNEGHPLLSATVAHAWFTHIHPFDDGNGRLARLLANMALTSQGYPPLIVRSADRGRYYDALAASDNGNILPLFLLFAKMQERIAARMSNDERITALIEHTFLASTQDRYLHWVDAYNGFISVLRESLEQFGWRLIPQGFPEIEEFELLARRDAAGNLWWAKLSGNEPQDDWLAWFGFGTRYVGDFLGVPSGYPSLFLSPRDEDPMAVRQYRSRIEPDDAFWQTEIDDLDDAGYERRRLLAGWIPNEVVVIPGVVPRALVRTEESVETFSVSDAAALVARRLAVGFG